jgi:hypothetical protein
MAATGIGNCALMASGLRRATALTQAAIQGLIENGEEEDNDSE